MRAGLVLLAVTVFLMLGILEVATRWLHADIGSTGDNTSYFAKRWEAAHGGGRNSLGFRDREMTARADGVTRIVVVGDSFTYGQGVEREERFTEQVQAGVGPDVDILNFGRPGANYEAHLANMLLALETAQPDIVILQWLYNDVQPAAERRPRPWHLAGPLHRFIQPYSALYFVANRGFAQLQRDLGLASSDPDYFDKFADPEGAPAMAARARLAAVLDAPEATGVPYGILLWPGMGDRSFASGAALFDQVLAVCTERDIPCLDLRPALAAAPPEASLMVSVYDGHPNALAHQLAAKAVLGWLPELLKRDYTEAFELD
jgi:lysophospholipase L1-like esterase